MYICLLRGVNVGGQGKVPMAELRDLLAGVGATRIQTYIQSGNAVFEHGIADSHALAASIGDALRARFGVEVAVLVLDVEEFKAIVAAQPFPHSNAPDSQALYIGFLLRPLGATLPSVEPPSGLGDDEFVLGAQAVYLRCPNGFGRTKLGGAFFERALGTPVTFRNWRTVLTLMGMAAG